MSDHETFWTIMAFGIFTYIIGFSTGSQWGQAKGIKWCMERNKEFDRTASNSPTPTGE